MMLCYMHCIMVYVVFFRDSVSTFFILLFTGAEPLYQIEIRSIFTSLRISVGKTPYQLNHGKTHCKYAQVAVVSGKTHINYAQISVLFRLWFLKC